MKKLKIYLETSAISNLDDKRNQKEMLEMHKLWELLKQDVYDTVISYVVLEEIHKNKNFSKINKLLSLLDQITFGFIDKSNIIEEVAEDIIMNNILTRKSFNDCLHLSCAMTSNCDCIVSYNMNHLVNIKTIKGVQALSMKYGYIIMNIHTAGALLTKGDTNDSRRIK